MYNSIEVESRSLIDRVPNVRAGPLDATIDYISLKTVHFLIRMAIRLSESMLRGLFFLCCDSYRFPFGKPVSRLPWSTKSTDSTPSTPASSDLYYHVY